MLASAPFHSLRMRVNVFLLIPVAKWTGPFSSAFLFQFHILIFSLLSYISLLKDIFPQARCSARCLHFIKKCNKLLLLQSKHLPTLHIIFLLCKTAPRLLNKNLLNLNLITNNIKTLTNNNHVTIRTNKQINERNSSRLQYSNAHAQVSTSTLKMVSNSVFSICTNCCQQ